MTRCDLTVHIEEDGRSLSFLALHDAILLAARETSPPRTLSIFARLPHTHGSSSKLVFVWMMRVFSASSPYRRETKRMAIARHCSSPPPSLSIPFG